MKKIVMSLLGIITALGVCVWAQSAEKVERTVQTDSAELTLDEWTVDDQPLPPGPPMSMEPPMGMKSFDQRSMNSAQRPARRMQQNPGDGPMHDRRQRPGQPSAINRGEMLEKMESLMQFLKENEPSLFDVLQEYRQENPDAFEARLPVLARIYFPVMEQMKEDPDMGKISLDKVRIKGTVQQALKAYQAAPEQQKEKNLDQLHSRVAELFDLTIKQQQLTVERWRQRLDKAEQWRELLNDRFKEHSAPPEQNAPPTRPMRERPDLGQGDNARFQRHAHQRRETLEAQIEKTEKALDVWRGNKEAIIKQRIEQLLSDTPPFPW